MRKSIRASTAPTPGRRQGGQDGHRVDEALVHDPEHDVDRDQGGQDEQRLVFERLHEGPGRALKRPPDALGHAQFGRDRVHGRHGMPQGLARGHVEGNGGGRELSLAVDDQGAGADRSRGDARQRRLSAAGRGQADGLQGLGSLGHAGQHAEHHPVLAQLGEHGRNLALAKGVVEDVVHDLGRDAVAGGGHPVDGEVEAAGRLPGGRRRRCATRAGRAAPPRNAASTRPGWRNWGSPGCTGTGRG